MAVPEITIGRLIIEWLLYGGALIGALLIVLVIAAYIASIALYHLIVWLVIHPEAVNWVPWSH